ncbi:MAG: hypothetical protein H6P94_425 [Thermoplasmatales archaeon]|nr:hypothetical protein [Thermoplasmatales archaeon]
MNMELDLNSTQTKLQKEMKHFFALTVMSLAFAGIVIAFVVASLTVNIPALRTGDSTMLLNSFSNIVISLIVGYLAFRFLISTAELLSRFDDIKQDDAGETPVSSESITGKIIQLMGLYREERPHIQRMILVSRVAGVCFFANALIQTVLLVINYTGGTLELASGVGGIIVSLIMGLVGFLLPSSFKKYAVCWDQRIVKGNEAEKTIASFLEDSS